MVKCVVSSCPNRQQLPATRAGFSRAPKRFFGFPKDPARIKVWLAALREPDTQDWTENHVICEDHFLPEDISVSDVSPDAIPIMPPCLEEGLGINPWPEDPEEEERWAVGDEEEEEEEEKEEAPRPDFTPRVTESTTEPPPDSAPEPTSEPAPELQNSSSAPQLQQYLPPSPPTESRKTFRAEVSLQVLTRQFLTLLLNSEGSIDLRHAAETLNTRIRRVYDVTNVLYGIDMIQKESTSRVRWTGKCLISSLLWNQQKMEHEYKKLKLVEETLDGLIKSCAQQLFDMTDDERNAASAYVTHTDIQKLAVFHDQTVIVIRAPEETKLEVPAPKADSIQIHLKSGTGPIAAVNFEEWPNTAETGQNSFRPLQHSQIKTGPLQTESPSSHSAVPGL